MPGPEFPFASLRLTSIPIRLRCAPKWSCDITLPDFDLWMILGGKGRLRIDGTDYKISSPQVFLFLPGQRVQGHHDPKNPLDVFFFHFEPQAAVARSADSWRDWQGRRIHSLAECDVLMGWCLRTAGGDGRPGSAASCFASALLAALWNFPGQNHPAVGMKMEILIREIRAHPARSWNLREMAGEAGICVSHFTGRFRSLTGCSPAQYVIRCRLEQAAVLLRETPLALKEIAEQTGYSDVFFFNRQFRQKYGRSPGAYRKKPLLRAGRPERAGQSPSTMRKRLE